MPRLSLTAIAVLSCFVFSGCDEKCNVFVGPCTPSCPENPEQATACEWVNQQCVPDSKCAEIESKRTVCTCTNQAGRLRWDCKIKHCSCTCPCGVLATASCNAVGCSEPEDECPPEAAQYCEIHCGDGGVTDGGGDGVPDTSADITSDTDTSDMTSDMIADLFADMDSAVDAPSDVSAADTTSSDANDGAVE